MQFYMAADERSQSLLQLHSSGKFIMLAEYRCPYQKKRERQGYGCRRTQSHRGKTPLSLFFFITQMQIKDIHQVCDSPQQITNCQLNHQLAKLTVTVDLFKNQVLSQLVSVSVCV